MGPRDGDSFLFFLCGPYPLIVNVKRILKKKKKKPTTTTTTTGEEVWRHKLNRVEECLVTLKRFLLRINYFHGPPSKKKKAKLLP